MLPNSNVVNTFEDEKRRQRGPVLRCEEESYSVTGMENSFCLFDRSSIWLNINNNSAHSSFARSEFCLSTDNQ